MNATTTQTTNSNLNQGSALDPKAHQKAEGGEGAYLEMQMILSVELRNKVCAAQVLLQKRRGIYWSFRGRSEDAPMSPDSAQDEFCSMVQAAIESYYSGLTATVKAAIDDHYNVLQIAAN